MLHEYACSSCFLKFLLVPKDDKCTCGGSVKEVVGYQPKALNVTTKTSGGVERTKRRW